MQVGLHFLGWTKRFAEQNFGVSPAERNDYCRQSREAGTGKKADQAAAQATGRARMHTESLLASFVHGQVVDADKHSGTARSDALLPPEARGGPGQSVHGPLLSRCYSNAFQDCF